MPTYDQRLEGLRTLLARAGVEPGQVTIGGSGTLGALGLRAPRDLDIHVPDEDAWKAMLAVKGGRQSVAPSGSPRVQFDTPTGEMEFFTGPWSVGDQEFSEGAPQMMHGDVPHWTAQHTLDWKKAMGRPKDQPDIAMLEQHLQPKTAQHKLSRRMYFRGLHISIETDKGELRHWYDPHNEEKGSTKMKYPYGYIRRTKGVDGDHVDVYVGPNERAKNVYIVHQMKAPEFTKYDEDKCMLGFLSAQAAKVAYLRQYNDKGFFGTMTSMPFEEFEKKVLHSFELKKPHKIAATPMQMVSSAFGLWPSLPDVLTGDTKGDTALEQLVEEVSPEEEPPTIEPAAVDTPAPIEVPGARKPAPDKAPETKKEESMDKEAVGTRIMPWQKLTRKMVEAATKKAPEVGGKRISPLAGLSAKDVQEATGRVVTGSAMLKAAYELGVSLAHEHHTKLAAGEGEIIRTIRRALQKGLKPEAASLAERSVREGRISEDLLKRLIGSGEGVLPAEAQLWQTGRGLSKMPPEIADVMLRGKPMEEVAQSLRGRAAAPAEAATGAAEKTTWQHTPEEMRAYARGGEEALGATTPAAAAPTSALGGAAEEAGASGGGVLLPVMGGAGLGAGGVLAGQSLAGDKAPALSSYYKTSGLAATLRAMEDKRSMGERLSDAGGVIKGRSSKAMERLLDKLGSSIQITGSRGGLLKAKTMKMPKPNVSSLPKTPKLQNVLAKLSGEKTARLGALLGRIPEAAQRGLVGGAVGGGAGALAAGEDNRLKGALIGALLGGGLGVGGQRALEASEGVASEVPAMHPALVGALGGAAGGAAGGGVTRAFAKDQEANEGFLRQLLTKRSQSLGDPAFWQGGEQAAAEPPPAASAEEVVTQLPLGTFQGMNTKISPEGERSTSVKVTPDALGSPEMLAAIFQAEPGAKVELETPEQPTADVGGPIEGGAGGPPLPEGMPQDANAAPPPPEMA